MELSYGETERPSCMLHPCGCVHREEEPVSQSRAGTPPRLAFIPCL